MVDDFYILDTLRSVVFSKNKENTGLLLQFYHVLVQCCHDKV